MSEGIVVDLTNVQGILSTVSDVLSLFVTAAIVLGLIGVYVLVSTIKEAIYLYKNDLVESEKEYKRINLSIYLISGLLVGGTLFFLGEINLLGVVVYMLVPRIIWPIFSYSIEKVFGEDTKNKMYSNLTKKWKLKKE